MDALLNTGEVPLNWGIGDAVSPINESEHNMNVWKFSQVDRGNQALYAQVTVPKGYIPGTQIHLNLGQYSPSVANTQLLLVKTYHVRGNQDGVDSPADDYTSTNAALTNTSTNTLRKSLVDLTDSDGKVGANAVAPGDLLLLELYRDASDTDSADVRFVPGATSLEVF
jgi:hypothetical protein